MRRYTLLHNPRCSKSREALAILQDAGEDIAIVDYQSEYLTLDKLEHIQKLLWDVSALSFTRDKEKEFKELWLSKNSSDTQIFEAMIHSPNLMQRPILIHYNKKAIVARDSEELKKWIKENG